LNTERPHETNTYGIVTGFAKTNRIGAEEQVDVTRRGGTLNLCCWILKDLLKSLFRVWRPKIRGASLNARPGENFVERFARLHFAQFFSLSDRE
jgi:hypothetical protein